MARTVRPAVTAKTPTSATGIEAGQVPALSAHRRWPADVRQGRRPPAGGFTLVELLAAIAIAGIVLAVSVPASVKMYQSMQYRSAVRDVVSALAAARHQAVNSGLAQDVAINPQTRQLRRQGRVETLPAGLEIGVQSAQELNTRGWGVIRFYPSGGSSGGGVDIENSAGSGVRISVDWLLGAVTQQTYVSD